MEIEFRQEFGAWERAGGRRAGRSMKELGKIGQKRSQEMYDANLRKALAIYNDKLKLDEKQIQTLFDTFLYLDYPYYKNPGCLMFSFYCLDYQKGKLIINEKRLDDIKSKFLSKKTKQKEKDEDEDDDEKEEKKDKGDISLEDVIRYCRMWILIDKLRTHYLNYLASS